TAIQVNHPCAALALAAIGSARDAPAVLFAPTSPARRIADARVLLEQERVLEGLALMTTVRFARGEPRLRASEVEAPAFAAHLAVRIGKERVAVAFLVDALEAARRTGITAPLLRDAEALVPALEDVGARFPRLHGTVLSILENVRHP